MTTTTATARRARKGDLVTVATSVWRAFGTDEDYRAWRESEHSKGMTCDGETKLSPRAVFLRPQELIDRHGNLISPAKKFRVLKMRAKSCPTSWSRWNHTPKGCCLLVDEDGVEWFAKPAALRVV